MMELGATFLSAAGYIVGLCVVVWWAFALGELRGYHRAKAEHYRAEAARLQAASTDTQQATSRGATGGHG